VIGAVWAVIGGIAVWNLYRGQAQDVHTTCLIARHLYVTQVALAHHLHIPVPHAPPTCPP
jgi:hypothetical protein